jgi:DNA-binding NarL/FixJ family response regulator
LKGTEIAGLPRPVKTHVGRVLSELQVENRAQAIVQGLKGGLVSLEELK